MENQIDAVSVKSPKRNLSLYKVVYVFKVICANLKFTVRDSESVEKLYL